jgi:hypothetical protein
MFCKTIKDLYRPVVYSDPACETKTPNWVGEYELNGRARSHYIGYGNFSHEDATKIFNKWLSKIDPDYEDDDDDDDYDDIDDYEYDNDNDIHY